MKLGLNKNYDPRSQKDIIFEIKDAKRLKRDCEKYNDTVGADIWEEEIVELHKELREKRGF